MMLCFLLLFGVTIEGITKDGDILFAPTEQSYDFDPPTPFESNVNLRPKDNQKHDPSMSQFKASPPSVFLSQMELQSETRKSEQNHNNNHNNNHEHKNLDSLEPILDDPTPSLPTSLLQQTQESPMNARVHIHFRDTDDPIAITDHGARERKIAAVIAKAQGSLDRLDKAYLEVAGELETIADMRHRLHARILATQIEQEVEKALPGLRLNALTPPRTISVSKKQVFQRTRASDPITQAQRQTETESILKTKTAKWLEQLSRLRSQQTNNIMPAAAFLEQGGNAVEQNADQSNNQNEEKNTDTSLLPATSQGQGENIDFEAKLAEILAS